MGGMRYAGILLASMCLPLLNSCEDDDLERREKAARFTTPTKPAPNPQREALESLVKQDRNAAPTTLYRAPKFKLISNYAGEDIRQVTGVSGRTLMLCFTAPWCAHSNRMRKELRTLANNEKGNVQVVIIDADKYTKLAKSFSITKVPTLIIYTEGVKLRTLEGAYTSASLQSYMHALLSQEPSLPGSVAPVLVPISSSN